MGSSGPILQTPADYWSAKAIKIWFNHLGWRTQSRLGQLSWKSVKFQKNIGIGIVIESEANDKNQ